MRKYDRLERYLSGTANSPLKLAFRVIEEIIRGALPQSARTHRAWWANDRTHVQALAWMTAHLRVAVVDLRGETVTFV